MPRFLRRRTLLLTALSLCAFFLSTQALRAAPPGGGGGPKTGTIVGEVVGASGPIGGASVLLFDGVSIDQVAETFTDANGNFQFRRVRAGSYTVTAISFNPPCSGSTPVTVIGKQTSVVVVACQ